MESRKRRPDRPKVPIGPTEAIRQQLGMSMENFGEAIGFSRSTYPGFIKKGFIVKTGALAAEALLQRQAQPGSTSLGKIFIVQVANGMAIATPVENLKRATWDRQEYYLIPTDE